MTEEESMISPTYQPTQDEFNMTIPTFQPTADSTIAPSNSTSNFTTIVPTYDPTEAPSYEFSLPPNYDILSEFPSSFPTMFFNVSTNDSSISPITEPTFSPTALPSSWPTMSMNGSTSNYTSANPIEEPTLSPFAFPTSWPTMYGNGSIINVTSTFPTGLPTNVPSYGLSESPSSTINPTPMPSDISTFIPSSAPTVELSEVPTDSPSISPTTMPTYPITAAPTSAPTLTPTTIPSDSPSLIPSAAPTMNPTAAPSNEPTLSPTAIPSYSAAPTASPTAIPTAAPTDEIIIETHIPSIEPTEEPTASPSTIPTALPSYSPSEIPSAIPSGIPTALPSELPTALPSLSPSATPSHLPTELPSALPTIVPSQTPTLLPTFSPSQTPTVLPTVSPSRIPTVTPSEVPSFIPSHSPTCSPTQVPTCLPTLLPTVAPSASPSAVPTLDPTIIPSQIPTRLPTTAPTLFPTRNPSFTPTRSPTNPPTIVPSAVPTTSTPTRRGIIATASPTLFPTLKPSAAPTNNYPLLSSNMLRQIQSTIGVNDSAEIVTRLNYLEGDINTGSTTACSSWTSWISTTIVAASYQYKPASITWWRGNDVLSSSSVSKLTCASSGDVKTIITKVTNAYLSSEKSTIDTISCGGSNWLIASCPSEIDSTTYVPYLCIDCDNPCDEVSTESFRISSCSTWSTTPSTYGVNVLSIAYKELTVAPKIITFDSSPLETSIIVDITLDVDGIVYVGLYGSTDDVPTSVDQVILQNQLSNTNGNSTQITLNNLQPATDYKIYIVAKSTLGASSTLSDMIATEMKVSTSCCRKIIVSIATQTISEGIDITGFITFSLPPSNEYLISLSSQVISNSTSEVSTPFVPSAITVPISSSTSSLTYKSSLSKLTAGNYLLSVILPSDASTDYQVVYNLGGSLITSTKGVSLTVLSQESPLPAPSLSQAIFSNDGSYVSITFDGNTNRAELGSTSFVCSRLLTFSCAETSRCQWYDASTIYAYVPNKDACASVGSKVSLATTAEIRAQCPSSSGCSTQTQWPISDVTTSLAIITPTNPISPSISISSPSIMGNCSTFTLDVSSSTGNGGRSWQNISITALSFDSDGNSMNTASLQYYLNQYFAISPPMNIPSKYFIAGQSYNFIIQLCNFFNKCSQNSKRVTVLSTIVPTVTIPGSSLRTIKRSQSLTISSIGSVKQCDSSASYIPLQYSWTIYKGTTADITLSSSSKDPSKLLLSSYSLQKNTMYKMEVIVTASSQSATTSIQVYVSAGDIIASVSGGKSNRNVRPSESLTLDASKSYDEDIENVYGASAGLLFTWSCIQLQPSLIDDCNSIFDSTIFTASNTLEILQLKTLSTASTSIAQITLLVTDSSASRSSSITIDIEVLPALAPTLALQSNVPSSSKMNSAKSLQLTASVNVPATVRGSLTWTADGLDSDKLSSVALTSITQPVSESSTTQSITMYLVLPNDILSSGSTYTFTMTSALESPGVSVSSDITVAVNAAPSPGTFSVTPRSQPELQDPFLFVCNNWQDSDLPISYIFSYYSTSSKSQIVMRSKSELTYASISLPAGSSSTNYTVITTAEVFDFLTASTTVTDEIQVFAQPEMSSSELSEYVGNSLSVLALATDVDVIKQQSALTSYLLNKVNCTLAPNCTLLNRDSCYRTAHTCGSCISSDYIGDVGDSNNMCLSIEMWKDLASGDTSSTRRLLETSGISQMKACPSDCSSHGTCIYRLVDNDAIVTECSIWSIDCYAECDCDSNYDGTSNCALTNDEVISRNTYRSQMISAVVVLTTLEDNTDANVISWINAMNDATVKSDEITVESALDILTFSQTTMNIVDSSVDITSSSLDSLLDTIDTITEVVVSTNNVRRQRHRKNRQLSSTTDDDVTTSNTGAKVLEVLQSYGQIVSSEMIPGQFPESQLSDYYNMRYGSYNVETSIDSDGKCQSSLQMELSLSANDEAYGSTPSSLILPTCKTGMTSTTLSVASLSSTLYGDTIASQFDSNPLSLYLSSFPCDAKDIDTCLVTIVLPRSSTLTTSKRSKQRALLDEGVEEVTLHCDEGNQQMVVYHCANGLNVTVACDGSTDYDVQTWCPIQYEEPNCNILNGISTEDAPRCEMIEYTDMNITCSCSLLPSEYSNSRRLSIDNSTIPIGEYSINYVSMMLSMTDTFEQTILTADDLSVSTLKDGWQAFVVIGVFAFVMICWILLAHYLDQIALQEFDRLQTNKPSVVIETDHDPNAVVSSSKNFLSFAEMALPQILSSSSWIYRLKEELRHHHRWIGVLFHYSKKFPRALRVISLATNIIVMLFVQSITYALSKGDDGSCDDLKSETACLDPRSPYSASDPKCYWISDSTSSNGGNCNFIQADNDAKVVIFVAIFSAMLSTPIALLVDWLIKHVLTAPILSDNTDSDNNKNMLALHFSDIVKAKAIAKSDRKFNLLSQSVKLYHQSLSDSAMRHEFALAWGLDAHGDFIHDTSRVFPSTATDNKAGKSLFSSCSSHHSGTELIRLELFEVERNLVFEKIRFQQELLTEHDKNKRLLYLFQKDLLPGISGQILESQGLRDVTIVEGVHRSTKWAAWLTLLLLDGGMLFYIFLFAVSQDTHRQNAWAQSFGTWLVIEIIVVSSLIVMLMNVLVPSVIMRDVHKIKKRLLASLEQYHAKMKSNPELHQEEIQPIVNREDSDNNEDEESIKHNPNTFNASQYLFVSVKLAKRYPDLKVAKIIREYYTSWPKQSYQRTIDVSKNYGGKFKMISDGASTIAMFFLTSVLSLPLVGQDMFIQMATTVVAGGIAVLHVDLYRVHPALIIIPILVVVLIAGLAYMTMCRGHKNEDDAITDMDVPIEEIYEGGKPKDLDVAVTTTKHVNQRDSVIQGVDIAKKAQVAVLGSDIESGGL